MFNWAKFYKFAAEIQSIILQACELKDLSKLSQTSHKMYDCVMPIMYRHINFSSHRTASDDLIDLRGFLYRSPQHEDNIRRQIAFIDSILRYPALGPLVSSLTWTIYPRRCSREEKCVDHTKMWEAWRFLIQLKSLDVYSLAGDWRDIVEFPAPGFESFDEDDFGPSAIVPPAVFPEAISIRIGGLMPYSYFRAYVSRPSIVTSLEMENLQGLLQPKDSCLLLFNFVARAGTDDHFWPNHTKYEETEDEDGIPVMRHGGPMRGYLQPLVGKFVQLKHLKISTAGCEVSRDLRWSEEREEKRYFEMANFIKSVAPTLVTFAFEQGVGLELLELWQVRSHNNTSTFNQWRRPIDEHFFEFMLPALLEGTWSKLEKFSVQGVGGNVRYETTRFLREVNFAPEAPEFLESVMHQLRSVMSDSVEFTFESETQRVFHMASLNVYMTRYIVSEQ